MKILKKFFISILIATLIFSFSPAVYAADSWIARMVEEIVVETFIGFGDGALYLISRSVGEVVTTDAIIYNDVSKLDINYWEDDGDEGSVKSIMSSVINEWYPVFHSIAMIVYMMVLIVAGIQILIHSTADKKAQYKEYLVSWVTGVMILCLFPFVMKYVVKLNEAAVGAMAAMAEYTPRDESEANVAAEFLTNSKVAFESFGNMEFVEGMTGIEEITSDNISEIGDPMLRTRAIAQENPSVILMIIYFILIGQMLVLLFIYYKRVFMLAFIITIFPLVAMTYAIDKMGDKKAQSFSIWFKEFVVNVIVQAFHAIVYVIVVDTTVKDFISTNGGSWLFMIISVLFLFEGEKILRNIFSIKSKAKTLGMLATTGAAFYAATKKFGKGKGDGSNASEQDTADNKGVSARESIRASTGANSGGAQEAAAAASGGTGGSTSGSSSSGQYTGNDPGGVANGGYDAGAAQDTVLKQAMARRLANGAASKAVRGLGKTVGTVAGVTKGMSEGDTADGGMLEKAIGDGYAGSEIGKGVVSPITAGVNMLERRSSGEKLARRIESGQEDANLGLNVPEGALLPPDIDPNEIIGKNGETMQEIYRQALAEFARTSARKGKAKGEVAYWNYIDEHTSNSN